LGYNQRRLPVSYCGRCTLEELTPLLKGTIMGFLDRLPAGLRHSILVAAGILVTALIQYIQTDYTNWNLPIQVVGMLGFVIPMALNYLTPWLTTQYGVGSVSEPYPNQYSSDVTIPADQTGH
jgi:hypothetical protein